MSADEGGTFQYANPETIHWGAGCVAGLLPALERAGLQRAFLVSTSSVAGDPALLPAVARALGARAVGRFTEIGQHAPARSVAAAAEAARAAGADALVSVGGGSPIDAAKAVAFALATGLDLAAPDASALGRGLSLAGKRVLPHFAVPTTLSVAELSTSAGFAAEGTHEKVGLAAPELRCAAVFYDAALAVHTPLPLWLSTGIRAVDHAVETLLAARAHPLPDTAALEGLRRLQAGLLAVKSNPQSLDARTDCQLGAWFSYLLPGPAARGLSHTLGKRLGSRHGVPHGVTSCLLLPHVMRWYAPRKPEPLTRIAAALGADRGAGQGALAAADAVSTLIAQLGLPQHLASYGLTDADLIEAARPLAGAEISLEDLTAILHAAV